MSLKPKTVRRLLVIGGAGVLIGLGGAGFVAVRNYQAQRSSASAREQGMAAYDAGRYPEVLDSLGRYLRRHEGDAPAMIRYARARLRVEEAGGGHLSQGASALRRYLDLAPDDHEAMRELLDCNLRLGLYPEAKALARRMRPASLEHAGKEHLHALAAEATAMLAMTPPDREAEAIMRRIVALDPLDCEWELRLAELLRGERKLDLVRRLAGDLLAAHPDDPRASLVAALAPLDAGDPRGARAAVERVAGLVGLDLRTAAITGEPPFPSEDYALRIVALLDDQAMFEHSLAVINAAQARLKTPRLSLLAARRNWQASRPEETVRVTEGARAGVDPETTTLVGLRGLALKQLGRREEAAAVARSLAEREGEFRASAWRTAIEAYQPEGGAKLLALDLDLRQAIESLPGEPVLAGVHAEVLAMLGRLDEAMKQWRSSTASLHSMGWALPWIRLSQASLQAGDVRSAVEEADMAIAQAPRSVLAAMTRFSAMVALSVSSRGDRPEIPELLAFAQRAGEALSKIPDREAARELTEEVEVSRVMLLLRAGRHDQAVGHTREMIGRENPPSRRALERLALISALEELGLEDEILTGAERAWGKSPTTEAVRAAALRLAGHKDEGFAILRAGAEGANAPDRVAWNMQIASYLDTAKDPAAGPAWISLADTNPENVVVQRSALGSPAACQDAGFVERAAARLAGLTGASVNQEVLMRVAKVRAMLSGEITASRREEVLAQLREIVGSRPGLVEARTLLADVLLMDEPAKAIHPQVQEAVVQLRSAGAASGDPGIRVRAAALLQEQRSFDEARLELASLARQNAGDPALLARIANMLVGQGDDAEAVPIFRSLVADPARATPEHLVAAASAMASGGDADEAAALFRRAASHPSLPLDALPAVASGLWRLGREGPAREAMERVNSGGVEAYRRILLGARFEELCGHRQAALAGYRKALGENPSSIDSWSALVGLQLDQGDLPAARQAVEEALAALPQEREIRLLRQRVMMSGAPASGTELKALADLLAADPRRATEAQAVRAVQELADADRMSDAQALNSLASRFSGNIAVQQLVVRRLASLTPPRLEEAANVAARAMVVFPRDPEPARLAAEVFSLQGRWAQTITACRAWKERDPGAGVQPDLVIAGAMDHLDRHAQAALQLRPHLPALLADPEHPRSQQGLALYASAQLGAGKHAEAIAAFKGALATSATLRNAIFLRTAAESAPTLDAALACVDAVRSAGTPDDPDDRVALASAFSSLGERFHSADMLTRARELLGPLVANSESPAVLELLAATLQRQGDFPGAAEAYRRAISISPNRVSALTNLAHLLVTEANDPREGVQLATRALSLVGQADAGVRGTCARVLDQGGLALKDSPEADACFARAVEVNRTLLAQFPSDPAILAALGAAGEHAGDFPAMIEAYGRLLDLPDLDPPSRAAARNNLAYALVRQRRGTPELARAESLLRQALDGGDNASFLSTLAMAQSALGRRAEATATFRRARTAAPDNPSIEIAFALHLVEGDATERAQAEHIASRHAPGAAALGPQNRRDLHAIRERLRDSANAETGEGGG